MKLFEIQTHLEADDVAEEFAGGVADHGDPGDDTVLAEEAPQDHVSLPDVRQVSALQEDLVRHGLAGEALPGDGAVELAVSHRHQSVDQAGGRQGGGELCNGQILQRLLHGATLLPTNPSKPSLGFWKSLYLTNFPYLEKTSFSWSSFRSNLAPL